MNRREEFGAKLRDIRILRGFTIEQVAEGTGLKPNTIKSVEAGNFSTPFDVIDKIAQFYGMELTIN
jgi:transcriptional regulator with XRE-family HTH domain